MRTRWCAPLVAAALFAGGVSLRAETNSYHDSRYEFGSLKTFGFKRRSRISQDPVANNGLWGDEIRRDLARRQGSDSGPSKSGDLDSRRGPPRPSG